ncbi:tetratricopeptide repeat protein [Undibacterium sp. SXout7W]|uniref:tetratricopeptide repeat protein n=1 Tax=Undibacterium sp. SXout7W TaxID=3413049 RepID=UPI003BF1AD05
MLAKRWEIDHDVLLPQQTQTELRQEWSEMASTVLSHHQTIDTSADAATSAKPSNHRLWISLFSATIALAIYAAIGHWDAEALKAPSSDIASSITNKSGLPPVDNAKHPGSAESIEDRIAQLENKLREAPDNLEGWVLLSRSRGIQRDFAGAAAALEKALALAPGHPDILADLADVLAMTNNKSLAGRPLQLIQEALKNAPDHPKALSLAATATMQNNDVAMATDYWKRLRATFPPGAADIAQVDAILASLKNVTPAPSDSSGQLQGTSSVKGLATNSDIGISGEVVLSPALIATLKKQTLPATAMLFVIAKSPSGPPMPLAVFRTPAQALADGKAVTFRLDDSQAMTPAMKLSSVKEANIEARISMAGTASKQSGDLSIVLPGVKLGTQKVTLEIRSVVP